MQQRERPVGVGLFFSLGRSAVVALSLGLTERRSFEGGRRPSD